MCVLLTFYITPAGEREQKIPQQGGSLLPGAGFEGQKKSLSAPFFCLACSFVVPGSLERPCRFLLLDGKLCGESVCTVLTISTLTLLWVFVIPGYFSPAQTEENICGAVNLSS